MEIPKAENDNCWISPALESLKSIRATVQDMTAMLEESTERSRKILRELGVPELDIEPEEDFILPEYFNPDDELGEMKWLVSQLIESSTT